MGYRHISRDIWRGNSQNFQNFQKPDITGYRFTWDFHLNQQFRYKIFQKSSQPDIAGPDIWRFPTVVCLCDAEHEPIEFVVDGLGNPVGTVKGNLLCWWGLFEWLIKDITNPDEKLVLNQWVV